MTWNEYLEQSYPTSYRDIEKIIAEEDERMETAIKLWEQEEQNGLS